MSHYQILLTPLIFIFVIGGITKLLGNQWRLTSGSPQKTTGFRSAQKQQDAGKRTDGAQ